MYLKQSTTTTVQLGPAVDATDGVTAETALSPTVYLSKGGAAQAARNSATAIAHDRDGFYRVELNTTDTGTVGRLRAQFSDASTHLPVWQDYTVLPPKVFDSIVGGTDNLEVDTTLISGDAAAADNLEKDYDGEGYDKAASTISKVASVTGNVAGNVTGSVGSLAAAAKTEVKEQVEATFDKALPGSPEPDSINARVKANLDAQISLTATPAEVRTQVDGALGESVDEQSAGAPPTSTSIEKMIGYLYKAFRNKTVQTATRTKLYNSDDLTVDHQATVEDDGTDFTRGKMEAAP